VPKIRETDALEAAKISKENSRITGAERASLQLLFYALSKDKNCSLALKGLVDAMVSLTREEEEAVVIAEYVLTTITDEKIKGRVTLGRRVYLNYLDLLSHPNTKIAKMSLEELETSQEIIIDPTGYDSLRKKVLKSHTLEQGFEAAFLFVGIRSGLMIPKRRPSIYLEFDDCFAPENF
jgi:hypothetical protein